MKLKYNDIVIRKKRRSFKVIIVVALLIMFFAGVYFAADVFSDLITVGNISIFSNTQFDIKEKKYFALTLGVYEEKEKAEQVAKGSTIMGASGFVWEQNNKYYIIGSVYRTRDELLKVIQNIEDVNYVYDELEIKLNAINIKLQEKTQEKTQKIKNIFKTLENIVDDLCNMAIQLDIGNLTYIMCASLINAHKSEVSICKKDIFYFFQNENIHDIYNTLIKIENLLDNGVLNILENINPYSSCKNSLTNILYEIYILRNKVIWI